MRSAYISIVGRPNVGKSTLLNAILGEKIAIVSKKPQTTRNRITGVYTEGDTQLVFLDTPGVHRPRTSLGKYMVDSARSAIGDADFAILVTEPHGTVGEIEEKILERIKKCGIPAILAVNKTDLCEKIDKKYIKSKNKHIVYISAQSGEGMQQLEQEILRVLHAAELNPGEGILYTERQRQDASHCLSAVEEAQGALQSGMTLDAVTVSVEAAVDALLELTGERATTAVVDEVFAHFCVGK